MDKISVKFIHGTYLANECKNITFFYILVCFHCFCGLFPFYLHFNILTTQIVRSYFFLTCERFDFGHFVMTNNDTFDDYFKLNRTQKKNIMYLRK